jgi:hypothetical protein
LNKKPYKVGDNISKFKDQFPLSYKNREQSKTDNNWFNIMISGADAGVNIRYNEKGKINLIVVANDNS